MLDLIKTRRSVRKFRPEPVSDDLIETILEAGRWAPSGLNNQAWRFAVVTNRAVIETISELTHYTKRLIAS